MKETKSQLLVLLLCSFGANCWAMQRDISQEARHGRAGTCSSSGFAHVLRNRDGHRPLSLRGNTLLEYLTSDNTIKISGDLTGQTIEARSLSVNGQAILNQANIAETIRIIGDLEGTGITAKSLAVTGNTHIHNTKLIVLSTFIGLLRVEKSMLGPVSISGGEMQLKHSTTGPITFGRHHATPSAALEPHIQVTGIAKEVHVGSVHGMTVAAVNGRFEGNKPDEDGAAPQTLATPTQQATIDKLFVDANSTIDGTITFENGDGEVHVCPDAQLKGHIIGGKVISDDASDDK